MNTNSNSSDDLNIALARLQAIQWDTLGMGEKDETLTELMLEFLSRVRQWAKFLQSGQKHIFENLALQIRPDIELPSPLTQWVDELYNSNRIPFVRGKIYVVLGVSNYLFWCRLREFDAVPANGIPDPYEPFITFLECGGGIYVEHHYYMDIYPNYVHFNLTVGNATPFREE
ncbi:hypothetical protein IQ276_021210 [Desmonostoc muscorum LEGE 12446]|uniref:Uncharacterized protein n=1 Tax=Desmonostoc muscorum LEGE 12446 TaxID=1828758 RepID=A0A8J7DJ52_DESMC|nr:hypothetical protein [Desmonostoc muscorum]MCF2148898.1 hypothetical protein [Desmonostoc muscorum LEGE 12446]